MHGVADIVVPENGQACNGVADAIVGLTEGLLAKKTIGGRDKAVEAYIGDFTHPAKPHIATPRDHASRQDAVIGFLFCVAAREYKRLDPKTSLFWDQIRLGRENGPTLFENRPK